MKTLTKKVGEAGCVAVRAKKRIICEDTQHKRLFKPMHALVKAWKNSFSRAGTYKLERLSSNKLTVNKNVRFDLCRDVQARCSFVLRLLRRLVANCIDLFMFVWCFLIVWNYVTLISNFLLYTYYIYNFINKHNSWPITWCCRAVAEVVDVCPIAI
jgi:hypothetical protein